MSEQLDCVVIGAGVVGLAVGRALAMAGREVVVLEREQSPGMHSSSRNSEVLHAGLYYPDDSLKAELCVAGNAMLYTYCDEHNVRVRRIGKLIVADDSDIDRLEAILVQGERNGVDGLQLLDSEQVARLEPLLSCGAALHSSTTGVIDSHAYMLALQADIEAYGGAVVCDSEIEEIVVHNNGFYLSIASAEHEEFVCNTLINAAGHDAHEIARKLGLKESEEVYLAKGHYFSYQGPAPFERLVYPVPGDNSLGIHATLDLEGNTKFGPDVSWVDAVDYQFDVERKPGFLAAIRQYFPTLDETRLVPGYTGIRPRLAGPDEPAADFLIQGEEDHGVQGLVNLLGIDSPGLTSSLAIGDYVKLMLD